jgi:hypothetical protein
MLLIITPVNLLSSSTSTFFWGGGGGWVLDIVPSCLSYLGPVCFESYVGHSLVSEIAVVDILYLLANAGIACSYRLSQVPRPFQLTVDNHYVSSDLTLHNQK